MAEAAPLQRSGDAFLDFLHQYRLPGAIFDVERGLLVYSNAQYTKWQTKQGNLTEQLKQGLGITGSAIITGYRPPPRLTTSFSGSPSSKKLWTATFLNKEGGQVVVLAQDDASEPVPEDWDEVPRSIAYIDLPWQQQKRFRAIASGGGEMGDRIRAFDWAQTPLGALNTWPQSRVEIVGLILRSPMPMTTYLGKNAYIIYNDGYRSVLGKAKHPRALGKTAYEMWNEIWPDIEKPLQNTLNGDGFEAKNHRMLWQRLSNQINEFEEVWANWCYIPVYDNDQVCANLHILYEHSDPILQRRFSMLAKLSEKLGQARTAVDLYRFGCEALSENETDFPYCLSYKAMALDKVEEQSLSPYVDLSSAGSATSRGDEENRFVIFALQDAVGAEFGSALAPERLVADRTNAMTSPSLNSYLENSSPWAAVFSQMLRTGEMVVVDDIRPMLKDVKPRGIAGITPFRAVCIPLKHASGEIDSAFILVLNPALPFDKTFERLLFLVSRQLSVTLGTVRVLEGETMRAEQLAALDRAKTSFFTSVSHELRTPLTLILGPLKDVLADGSLTKSQSAQLTLVHRNARRLLRLVNSILDFARAEAGRMQASFSPVVLGPVTAELAASFKGVAELAGLEFTCTTRDDSAVVWVDLEAYEKIVYNILSNALKFTTKGSISVTTWTDRHNFYFKVTDTGIGIPADQLSSIFDKFHRVQAADARAVVGSGIGLSLTLELVKLHVGRMSVDSTYQQGSTFIARFPLGNEHLPKNSLVQATDNPQKHTQDFANTVAEETALWASKTEYSDDSPGTVLSNVADPFITLPFGPRKEKPAILVCDDNSDIRAYIRGVLGKYCQIAEAVDGVAALEKLEAEDFDLLLSDIMMPRKDGYQLLRDVRAHPRLKSLPVILLSARAGEDVGLEGLRAGADEYLTKPFTSKELTLRVQQHLQLGNIRMELEHRVNERTALLEESQGKYFRLADYLQVGIHTTDVQGSVTWANRRWQIVMDLYDETQWDKWASRVHPEDLELAKAWFERATNSGMGGESSLEVRLADSANAGQYIDVIYDLQAELDANGHLTGFIGVFQDITSVRRLERERVELERSKRQQAEASRIMQETHIDITCHELRNPLNAISNLAELLGESLSRIYSLLQQDSLQPKTEAAAQSWHKVQEDLQEDLESVRTIVLCARHQKRIADDVLNISKLHGNLVQLVPEPFNPVTSVEECIKMFQLETNAKDIVARFERHPTLDLYNIETIVGDPGRFTQIVVNLLSNAIRFTEKASRRLLRIGLGIEPIEEGFDYPSLGGEEDDLASLLPLLPVPSATNILTPKSGSTFALHFAIADSGAGMSTEEKARIFQRFVQASPKTYREFGGIGLGLWISKRLVELHGGKIDLQSIKDQGTVLRFYIRVGPGTFTDLTPMAPPQSTVTTFPDGPNMTPQEERYFEFYPRKHVPSTRKPRVLVVEDNAVNQKVLTRLLRNLGSDVTTADDGLDCLRKIESHIGSTEGDTHFDLILMDLEMFVVLCFRNELTNRPNMDGLTATTKIREAEESGRYPRNHLVVAVSANSRDQYVQKASQVGMQGYLRKPYSKTDLSDLLAKFIVQGDAAEK